MMRASRMLVVSSFLIVALCGMTQAQEGIKSQLHPFVERGAVPGYVALVGTAQGQCQIVADGYADPDKKLPMKKDSMFRIASMTKTITAAAVLVLVTDGKIGLDDPVSKYYPGIGEAMVYVNGYDPSKPVPTYNNTRAYTAEVAKAKKADRVELVKIKRSPTIRELLSHTSGLHFLLPCEVEFGSLTFNMDQTARFAGLFPFRSQPGEAYNYSNVGTNIAAAIVEKVSGQRFGDFLRDRVFKPLEMNSATFFPTQADHARMPVIHGWDDAAKAMKPVSLTSKLIYTDGKSNRVERASGGLIMTIEDYYHFCQMIVGGGQRNGNRIIAANLIDQMTHSQTKLDMQYGFLLHIIDGGYEHGGAYGTR
ncbi:MAG: serine hydrolase domain-containing protein, partial [Planctomycetia bacterium]|nr:serine hydrolase domain-containing protein [Planctomycetia bacterium]